MLFRSLASFLFLMLFSFPLYAAECLDIFPSVSQNYGPQLTLPNFKYSSENDGDKDGNNLALASGQYKDVKVGENGSVFFTELNAEYRLKKLELKENAIAQFVPGDYWIEDLSFGENTTLAVVGTGTVRIYVQNAQFNENSHINDANGSLIFISYSDVSAGEDFNFTGVMYALNNIDIDEGGTIIGAITADSVDIDSATSKTYQQTSISNADFNGMCEATATLTPIANYLFDECAYTGVAFDTFDQTGNYSATSQNSMASTATGIVERAADISDFSQHFTTSIPLPSDFTVSTWFKKPTSTSDSNIFVLGAMQNGGDLLVLDRNNGWYWGIYDGTNTVYSNSYSFASLDNNWHHMVLMYQSGISYLVIDGVWVDTINRAPSGTLKYIGTSLDFVGTSNAQGFRAPLDEFMVFNQTLTLSEMQTIYNNQLADKNYDASTRTTVTCNLVPIANYRFDECAYTGIAADTIDKMANYAATSHNSMASTSVGVVERAADITNHEQHFITSIALPADFSISTWFKKPTATTGSKYFVLGAMEGGGDLLVLDRNNSWRWGVYNGSNTLFGNYSFETEIQDNNWHHMALMYQSGISYLVIDGIWVDTINTAPSGTLKYIGTSFDSIGTSDAQGFRAPLDEFMVFNQTLTLAEMQSIYNNQFVDKNYDGSSRAAVSCTPVIDHYLIEHNGQGLTCETERVAVRACTNVYDGSTCVESNESISLDLVATGGTNSVSTTTAFVGSTIVEFNYTVAENIVLSTANESIGASNTTVCNDNSSDSCNMVFENAGFIFTGINAIEVAGVANTDVTIQAVKDINSACVGLFDEPKDIDFAIETLSPSSTGGNKYTIGSNEIDLNLADSVSNYKTVSLNFAADTIASLSDNTYFDAGDITLHAKYTIAATSENPAVTLLGSATFYVRPYEFKITATNSDNQPLVETLATGAKTQKAGVGFNLLIEAVNQQGVKTANFTDKFVELSLQRIAPIEDGVDGTLTYDGGSIISSTTGSYYDDGKLLSFTNGQFQDSQIKFNEVGLLNIAVREVQTDGNTSNHALGSQSLGRFIPDHFVLTANMVENSCVATNFTYMNEPSLTLTYEIQAHTSGEPGTLTQNYLANDSEDSKNFVHAEVTLVAENSVNGIDLGERLTDYQGSWINGRYSPTGSDFLNEDVGNFNRTTTPDGPYEQLIFGLKLIDDDGALLNEQDMLIVAADFTAKKLWATNSKLRFGRWFIENTSGSENSALPQIMRAEYYNGSSFVTNTLDSCTIAGIADKEEGGSRHDTLDDPWDYRLIQRSDNSEPIRVTNTYAEIEPLLNQFGLGAHRGIQFIAPTVIGDLEWQLNVPVWMQYDWQGNGTHDDNPFATLKFGVYRGNDRIISWREVGN
ncbi:MAG: LamG domain-containing protein [Colwellia sp.]|nr:LamG domain-containing protein [Colwellia sp.]